ncbi:methyltransferase domain-containing protein [Streptomyces sp. NBC_00237]|uniref:methyltransferase domain-containing protein n=1 Tax=Streptomyces sp. NBC_00237 TaxID=2975687 RepID=UPI0022517F40|nr:methyltransferase domain-containing protein [Streptomyces sp. NBC_00237]MCX5201177.1 methyltransferase domain-containing protein [Streptomyces sp. NBC_00237]
MGATAESGDLYSYAEERDSLVREIAAAGALKDPAWRAAFTDVPRHLFVPYWFRPGPGGYERLWAEDPDPRRRARWLRGTYADTALATRVRDGILLSSSSQPSLMARMLDELEVRDGHRVLEIGAGTGYNAALLSHRLGEDRVTTLDLDAEIVESARAHLAKAGYAPVVEAGDGAGGCPARAPFDRIMATCTVPSVPAEWLRQCVPGARILAPLSTGLIALRVRDEGYAEGRFLPTPAYFVPLRGGLATPTPRYTGGLPRTALENDLFRFLLSLSTSSLDPHEALALWHLEGRPRRERFGVTVTSSGQWAWLDDPDGPYAWPL